MNDTASSLSETVYLWFYDGQNSSTTQPRNVFCYVVYCDPFLNDCDFASGRHGCTSSGGCTTDPGAYTGSNSILFSSVDRPAEAQGSLYCWLPYGAGSCLKAYYYSW
jgi:hypothetical protein